MPVFSEIDKEKRVILRRVKGALTIQDVLGALESTTSLPGYESGMGAIWDYSEGTIESLSSGDLKKLAAEIRKWVAANGPIDYRVAVFAPKDIDFGLSRVYEALSEIQGNKFEFSVFRDLGKAIQWVNGIDFEAYRPKQWFERH